MGRGLSSLQRFILVRALNNELERLSQSAMHRQTLVEYYGFPEKIDPYYGTPVPPLGTNDPRFDCFGQYFNVQAIGKRRYRAAQAAVSRALRRLEARGLVEGWPHKLTEAGVAVAIEVRRRYAQEEVPRPAVPERAEPTADPETPQGGPWRGR